MTAALQVEDAVREYPGEPPVRALGGVSLTIDPGELVAIVGRSGSGKSTLMHLAGALDTPTAGTVRVAGYDIAALTDAQRSALRSRHVGFVFQQFFLDPHRSALANVADGLLYAGIRRAEREAAAGEALTMVGLAHRLQHRPDKLSGGERQRVAVARAVVGGPSLLLADEPTGNLDQASGAAVLEVLRTLQATGAAVVIVTHDHAMAAGLPRRIEIADGRIVRDERGGVAA
jgi:putative ABC transport system ATP-binding protein